MNNKIILLFACSMFCASDITPEEIPKGDTSKLIALRQVLQQRYPECLDPAANQAAIEEYNQIPAYLIQAIKGAFDAKNELKAYIKEEFPNYNYDQIDSIIEEWTQFCFSEDLTFSDLFRGFLNQICDFDDGDAINYSYALGLLKLRAYKTSINLLNAMCDFDDGAINYSYPLGLLKLWEYKASFQEMASLRASCKFL